MYREMIKAWGGLADLELVFKKLSKASREGDRSFFRKTFLLIASKHLNEKIKSTRYFLGQPVYDTQHFPSQLSIKSQRCISQSFTNHSFLPDAIRRSMLTPFQNRVFWIRPMHCPPSFLYSKESNLSKLWAWQNFVADPALLLEDSSGHHWHLGEQISKGSETKTILSSRELKMHLISWLQFLLFSWAAPGQWQLQIISSPQYLQQQYLYLLLLDYSI